MNVCNPPKITEAELELNFQAFIPCLFLDWEEWPLYTFRATLHWKNPWEEDQSPINNGLILLVI